MSDEQPIQDKEDYIQKRRIKSIFNSRDNLHEKRRKIEFESQGTGKTELLTAYRSLVSDYLMQVEPLMEKYDMGTELLKETSFGTLEVRPNTRTEKRGYQTQTEIQLQTGEWVQIEPEEVPQKQSYNLNGLISLHRVPNPAEITEQIEVLNPHNTHTPTKEIVTYTQKSQITMSTLDLMTRGINQFLAQAGFELEQEPDKEPHQI